MSLKQHIVYGIILSIILTAGSYGVGLWLGWLATVNILEAFAVFTSYLCTFLCVMQRRINYPIGAISTAAYCVLFWQAGLLASMALNAALTPYLLYGWLRWGKDNSRPVSHVQIKWLPVYALVVGLFFLGVLWMVGVLGGTLALTDSIILVGSVLAQLLMDNKKIDNWAVWAVVNVFAIYTYYHAGLALAAFQYVFFLGNTIWGWVMWQRSKKESNDEVRDYVPAQESGQAVGLASAV